MNERDRLLGAMADGIGAMAFLTESGGRIVWCNHEFEVQTGFTVADLQLENPESPFIHPDDLPRVDAFLAAFAAGEDEVRGPLHHRFVDRRGAQARYRSVVRRTEWNGELAILMVCTRVQPDDAVSHTVRESDERYRRLVERANDAIVQLSADGAVVFANERFHALVGLDAVDLSNVRFADLVHVDDRARAERMCTRPPKEGARGELRVVGPAASEHLVEIDLVPLDEISGVQGILRDITRQRAVEERVREQQKLESLGLLAGRVAHDFNNVLTGVLGNLSLARMEASEGGDVDALLEDAERATQQAAGLAHGLLVYAGRAPARRGVCDLGQLLSSSEPLLAAAAGRGAALTLVLPSEPLLALADATQLTHVLQSLVRNACEATGPHGRVVVETDRVDAATLDQTEWLVWPPSGPRWAVLRVRDDGPGIANEVRQRMFDPFFSTKEAGRGLGLSSAVGIVRSHGGGLRVQSKAGAQGTVVEVLLPFSDAVDTAASRGPAKVPAAPGRVLVVDDEPAIRALISRALQRQGLLVDVAEHGEAALAAMSGSASYGLVILDYTMPGMNGGETLARIRAVHGDVPVLRISGFASEMQWGAHTEPSRFLPKPFAPRDLFAAVRQLMSTSQAN